jgi:hypothetical protein
MLFRQRNAIDASQLEELRRQDARRVLERECRFLRRQYSSLEKDHKLLRSEHDFQCMRLDSMVVQSGALLTLINGLTPCYGNTIPAAYEETVTMPASELATMKAEKQTLTEARALLMRKNMDLEFQLDGMMTQFGSLLTDYEGVRVRLTELTGAATSAVEEPGDRWVQL